MPLPMNSPTHELIPHSAPCPYCGWRATWQYRRAWWFCGKCRSFFRRVVNKRAGAVQAARCKPMM